WMSSTRVGSDRFSSSKQRSNGTPRWNRYVPIAPSASSGARARRSRNGVAMGRPLYGLVTGRSRHAAFGTPGGDRRDPRSSPLTNAARGDETYGSGHASDYTGLAATGIPASPSRLTGGSCHVMKSPRTP